MVQIDVEVDISPDTISEGALSSIVEELFDSMTTADQVDLVLQITPDGPMLAGIFEDEDSIQKKLNLLKHADEDAYDNLVAVITGKHADDLYQEAKEHHHYVGFEDVVAGAKCTYNEHLCIRLAQSDGDGNNAFDIGIGENIYIDGGSQVVIDPKGG